MVRQVIDLVVLEEFCNLAKIRPQLINERLGIFGCLDLVCYCAVGIAIGENEVIFL